MASGFRLPIVDWLLHYRREWLGADCLAGLTLAAYAVPVSLAYASLAGLPPQMGLYCYFAGGVGYALFGSSRQLAIGPTSAISLLLGASLMDLIAGRQISLQGWASVVAVLMACTFLVAWLLRLSVLVNFISESILTGFKAGAALVIAATQLPKLLGVPGGGDDFFARVWHLGEQLGSTQLIALAVGGVAILLLVAGGRWLPGKPVALVVVILALVAVAMFGLEARGLRVVGEIPAGLPHFQGANLGITEIARSDLRQLIRLAFACFLLSYVESVSAARTFALKHRYEIDARQELLGLGAASLFAGLFQGYPIAGGLSQTAVNERSGAKTPLSLVVASIAIGCVLLFLTGMFRTLPDAVLAAVVLVAIAGLIDIAELRHLWRVSRLDFAAASIAFIGVLCMGVLDGVVVAVLASVGMLLWRSSQPTVAFLGRIPGTNRFSDIARHPDNEPLVGILAFRPQASLLYYNADHVRDVVLARATQQAGLRRVVCDLSTVPYVDVSGSRMLKRLHQELADRGLELKIAEPHGPVRDILRSEGLEALVGTITRHVSLVDILESA